MDIHYWEVIWPKLCGHETITLKGLPQTVARVGSSLWSKTSHSMQ